MKVERPSQDVAFRATSYTQAPAPLLVSFRAKAAVAKNPGSVFTSPVCRERPTLVFERRVRDHIFRDSGCAEQQTSAPHKLSLTLSPQTGEEKKDPGFFPFGCAQGFGCGSGIVQNHSE